MMKWHLAKAVHTRLASVETRCSGGLRDGNGAPFPDSPWGIHPLGDGDGYILLPMGN
jgi:hypothetical protein